jgi:hypothetical protein
MLKRINILVLALALFSVNVWSAGSIDDIKTQMRAIKRAWNSERLRIKIAQKASITAYQTLAPVFDKIIASDAFTTKLNDAVSRQFDAIVNNNMAFSPTTEFNILNFFPNLTMTEFGKKLFSAMANKAYYLELGKKLAQRIQELQMIVTIAAPSADIASYPQ